MQVEDELRLSGEPDAVPRARRFVTAVLAAAGIPDSAETTLDAQLVVTELVTNALLHARPPVTVRVRMIDSRVRLEVDDPFRSAPIRALASTETMTGRGLALVDALTQRWGVEASVDGKTIWCELGGPDDRPEPAELGFDELLDAWADDHPTAEKRYTVSLGDVPTDLLLAAKAHVDNIVRELTLADTGARTGTAAEVPSHLAALIRTVVHDFADARQEIKRQALAAAAAEEPRTRLTLHLPASAADAGLAYLSALDAVDSYARAARLLTLESPPQHRAFRRWYVEALVSQLRQAARGEVLGLPQSLEQRLLEEYGTVAAAHRATDRAARLQNVTAALAATTTTEDVAAVVVSEGVAALDASGGTLLLPGSDERLSAPAAVGYAEELLDQLRAERPDANLPGALALRSGEPVWIESRQEQDVRFPDLPGLEPGLVALCAVPLTVSGRVLGVLRFSFDGPRLFDEDERRFISALAAQTAQALERSALYDAERQARAAAEDLASRLARLQRVSTELAVAAEADYVTELIVTHLADALGAEQSGVCVLDGPDTLRIAGARGVKADVERRWHSFPLTAELPASLSVRTNAPVLVRGRADYLGRFPDVGEEIADTVLVCLPLSIGERRLGVVSLRFPAGREFDAAELQFLGTLADTCAQALDRAEAMARAEDATAKLAFLAEASATLSSSLDPRETLASLARLIVPRQADWCAVQVVEDGELKTLAVTHVDPAKVAWARQLQERYPTRLDAPTGLAQVIRTGEAEMYPVISDEMLVAGAVDEEHLRISRELGLASAVVVPLTGHAGTFGGITMIYAESGRRYGEADLALLEDLARRAAIAVENAQAFQAQQGQLAAMTRVAEAAQHAILAPVPLRAGPVRLSAAYVSAARDALVGGDLYEVVARPGVVRLLIGDVRGKGLDAVRLATVVLGHFRSAAVERESLAEVARQIDARLLPYLADEDFVTALFAEIRDDGTCEVAVCGHPPALLSAAGELRPLGATGTLPLGLGADPVVTGVQLHPGNRLLLYTDGILEARAPDRSFVPLERLVDPVREDDLPAVLDHVLGRLRTEVAADLGDDVALLLAEYSPHR